MARRKMGQRVSIPALLAIATLLAGCEEGAEFNLFQPAEKQGAEETEARTTRLVERDVEAPEVFQATEPGLWDGRPSLGGVWVAHPEVEAPERAIIRNTENGTFVIGALFRREREMPGPRFQVSSDAAAALQMLAGQPAELNVTVLRREEVPVEPEPAADQPDEGVAEPEGEPEEIEETSIDPIESAAAAIDAAGETDEEDAATAALSAVRPPARPTPPAPDDEPAQAAALDAPYIQIGIFSVEENANDTATSLRMAGMIPRVSEETLDGKTFWRVVVGPAGNSAERAALVEKVKELGFEDAYFVKD